MRCPVCHIMQNGIKHMFSGYGWAEQYCEEHCPRKLDGTECDDHDG